MRNINEIFSNSQNIYYGHGTGLSGNGLNVVKLICDNGLRCTHKQLNYTTIALGFGGNIDESVSDMLDNWPYANSKKIIIISVPAKYRIFESTKLHTQGLEHIAYCYNPLQDGGGFHVIPEFIYGCYDADKKKFVKNPRYYEFLPKQEKDAVIKVVRTRYVDFLQESAGLKRYKDIMSEEFPQLELPSDVDFECYDNNFINDHMDIKTKRKRK